jgi:hypothetical protein
VGGYETTQGVYIDNPGDLCQHPKFGLCCGTGVEDIDVTKPTEPEVPDINTMQEFLWVHQFWKGNGRRESSNMIGFDSKHYRLY